MQETHAGSKRAVATAKATGMHSMGKSAPKVSPRQVSKDIGQFLHELFLSEDVVEVRNKGLDSGDFLSSGTAWIYQNYRSRTAPDKARRLIAMLDQCDAVSPDTGVLDWIDETFSLYGAASWSNTDRVAVPQIRHVIVEALHKMGAKRSAPVCMYALGDGFPEIRKAAARALAAFGDERWLSAVRGDAGDLARIVDVDRACCIPSLIAALTFHDNNHMVQTAMAVEAARLLGAVKGEEALKWLIRALETSLEDKDKKEWSHGQFPVHFDERVREAAARSLGEIRDERALWPLTRALANPVHGADTYSVRVAAAEALGKLGSRLAIPSLIAVLPSAHPPLRLAAARALSELGEGAMVSGIQGDELDCARLMDAGQPAVIQVLANAIKPREFMFYEKRNYYDPRIRIREDAASLAFVANSVAHAKTATAVEMLAAGLEDAERNHAGMTHCECLVLALANTHHPAAIEKLRSLRNGRLKDCIDEVLLSGEHVDDLSAS